MNNSKNYNLAIAITSDYILYAYVLLTSFLENNQDRATNVYILYTSISESNLSILELLESKYQVNIICQEITSDLVPENILVSKHWPKEVYYRAYLPIIIPPDQDRVLYLDTDIIVNKSIHDFYDIDFNNKSIVACQDQSALEIGLTDKQIALLKVHSAFKIDDYFNSGVLLMNLHRLRDMNFSEMYLSMMRTHKDLISSPDQDLLNLILFDDVILEDPVKYNFFARLNYNRGLQYQWAKKNVSIIHFAGRKPWTGEAIRYSTERLWWEYAKLTPDDIYYNLLEYVLLSEIDSSMVNDVITNLTKERDTLASLVQQIKTKLTQ